MWVFQIQIGIENTNSIILIFIFNCNEFPVTLGNISRKYFRVSKNDIGTIKIQSENNNVYIGYNRTLRLNYDYIIYFLIQKI